MAASTRGRHTGARRAKSEEYPWLGPGVGGGLRYGSIKASKAGGIGGARSGRMNVLERAGVGGYAAGSEQFCRGCCVVKCWAGLDSAGNMIRAASGLSHGVHCPAIAHTVAAAGRRMKKITEQAPARQAQLEGGLFVAVQEARLLKRWMLCIIARTWGRRCSQCAVLKQPTLQIKPQPAEHTPRPWRPHTKAWHPQRCGCSARRLFRAIPETGPAQNVNMHRHCGRAASGSCTEAEQRSSDSGIHLHVDSLATASANA